jgi:hypothetical protein
MKTSRRGPAVVALPVVVNVTLVGAGRTSRLPISPKITPIRTPVRIIAPLSAASIPVLAGQVAAAAPANRTRAIQKKGSRTHAPARSTVRQRYGTYRRFRARSCSDGRGPDEASPGAWTSRLNEPGAEPFRRKTTSRCGPGSSGTETRATSVGTRARAPVTRVAVHEDRAVLVGSEDQHVGAGLGGLQTANAWSDLFGRSRYAEAPGTTWRQPAPEGSTVRYTATPIPG